jgi:thiol-disulfide isomerase/thioredoxin
VPRPPLLAVILAGALAVAGCSGEAATAEGPRTPQLEAVDPGENGLIAEADRPDAPPLVGTTLEGEPLDVADYRGKVVVLNFWASWCPPCRAEAANLIEVAEQTEAEGVQFIGVNVKNARTRRSPSSARPASPTPRCTTSRACCSPASASWCRRCRRPR